MLRMPWVGLLGLVLLAGCASSASETRRSTDRDQTLEDAARDLGLRIEPTGYPEDRMLVDDSGRCFYVMVGKPYYRFMGDRREAPPPGVRASGRDLILPVAMVDSMRADLTSAPRVTPDIRAAARATTPDVRPTAPTPPLAKAKPLPVRPRTDLRVVIDPGHGGKDPGATPGGRTEKAVNLAVSLRVAKILRDAGHAVTLTRETDTYPSLDARAALANDQGADLFVSIHANTSSKTNVQGVEAYYRADGQRGEWSRRLANAIVEGMVEQTSAQNRRARSDPRGLRVLARTRMPAVLVEMGFMTHPEEGRKLADPGYQAKLAQGIAQGILRFARSEYAPTARAESGRSLAQSAP